MDYRIYDLGDEETESEATYKEDSKRKGRWILLILLAIIVVTLLSLYIGNLDYSFAEITSAIFTFDTDRKSVV